MLGDHSNILKMWHSRILMQCCTSWYAVRVGVNIGVLEKSIGARRIKKHSLIIFTSKMYSEQSLKTVNIDICIKLIAVSERDFFLLWNIFLLIS
ncbi:unnamed protein product [Brugia pahangi]|uniref:Ovule protein n=1 Tax=Brugia pahangi TaxID=6280 RepID=A0A0N4TK20_BRUPA|nr:unnamed protein product [Brugia pahangi]